MRKFMIMMLTLIGFSTTSNASDLMTLSTKHQAIVPIAAFTANGDLEKLKPATISGLEAGLSINEIKEVMVHLYAYTGFPRSLNALNAFMALLEERKAKGIEDEIGKEATPVPQNVDKSALGDEVRAHLVNVQGPFPTRPYMIFSPTIDVFLKEHLFYDIFKRDILDFQTRELVTISALANLPGAEAQLRGHMKISMNMGLSPEQMKDFVNILDKGVDTARAKITSDLLAELLK